MLAVAKPDIVAVCPRYLDHHGEMLLAAAASGARGIYVEKPFCRTPAEADALSRRAKRQV
jgi:predicted dehydrogenase